MTAVFAQSGNLVACGGMDNMLTIYDLNNRDSSGVAKMVREVSGYEVRIGIEIFSVVTYESPQKHKILKFLNF